MNIEKMNFGFADIRNLDQEFPERYQRTPFVVFDLRTREVKESFTTPEEAGGFAVFCQQAEDKRNREAEILEFCFGKGAA